MDRSILVLAKAYPPVVGGVETYSESIVRAYLRIGIAVQVITQTLGESGWSTTDYPEGRVLIFNTGPGGQAITFLKLLLATARARRAKRFDFIHSTTWRAAIASLPAWRGGRSIITVHGREILNYPWFLRRPMESILAHADTVITVSNATHTMARAALRTDRYDHWRTAFNGISHPTEASEFHRPQAEEGRPIRILSLATLVPRKNIQGCLQALNELKNAGTTNFEYLIAGKGPMMTILKDMTRKFGLEGKVTFLGYVPDSELPNLYKKTDIFLHPQTDIGDGNDFEGFGIVIADAMSFGCTVIAGSHGGPSDFISHRINGILVDGTDHKSVIESLKEAIHNREFRKKLGTKAKEFSLSDLSWDNHAMQVIGAATK